MSRKTTLDPSELAQLLAKSSVAPAAANGPDELKVMLFIYVGVFVVGIMGLIIFVVFCDGFQNKSTKSEPKPKREDAKDDTDAKRLKPATEKKGEKDDAKDKELARLRALLESKDRRIKQLTAKLKLKDE